VHALLLAAIGLWCFLVALAGGLAGLVLGNIRLPVLLFASSSPAAAGGANIAISGLAAAAAALTHVRARRVDWRLVAWMLPPSVAGALVGGYAAGHVPADALRIVIGTVLLAFGLDLLRPRRGGLPAPRETKDVRAAVVAGALIGVLGGLVDWTLLWVGAAGSIPGALLGSRLTGRLSVGALLRTVAVILLVAGIAAIVQGAL
jgi:uncharacterized membrane protein YfcA